MSTPLVSIVVPVYNGANYLRAAIDSALAQTWPRTEVIVVNDGSTDDGTTDRIARSYGERIRYVAKPNGGVASALNTGIAAMRGEIFCWLSHDDRHLRAKTTRQVAEWERRGRPDAVLYSDYRLIDTTGEPIIDVRLDHAMLEAKPVYALLRGSIHGCSVFVPRRLFEAVGTFDESLPTTQDYDLWHRMIRRFPFLHMPEILIESRWHDEQGSKKIDYEPEATAFWLRAVESIDEAERVRLEGSSFRFLTALGTFLGANGLGEAAARLHEQGEEALASTLVSVVIPVHNRLDLAVSAVESAAAQTHPAVEIIVVDDGSTEDSTQLEAAIAHHAPRAVLLRQANRGPAAARNAGWEAARGRFVAFLDADDLFLPEKISAQVRAMEQAGSAFGHTSYFRQWVGEHGLVRFDAGSGNAFPAIIGNCGIATPTVMLRRDLWDEGYRFPNEVPFGEDVVLWLHIAARHGTLGLDRALSVVRASATSHAYDPVKQAKGVAHILAAVRSSPELAAHEGEVARLTALLESLSR